MTLHLGAHRTSSTSAQRELARRAAEPDCPYRFAGPETLRPRATQLVHAIGKTPGLHALATPLLLRWVLPEWRDFTGTRRMAPSIVSDEVFLGSLDESLLDPRGLYPDARRRLRGLSRLFADHSVRIVFTVRPYADWFTSAYAWRITRRPLPPPRRLANDWMARARKWPEVVSDIIDVFGACEVIDFRSVREDPGIVIRTLTGASVDGPAERRFGQSHKGSVIRSLVRRHRQGKPVNDEVLRRLVARKPPGLAFDPFGKKKRAELGARYETDLERIVRLGAIISTPHLSKEPIIERTAI